MRPLQVWAQQLERELLPGWGRRERRGGAQLPAAERPRRVAMPLPHCHLQLLVTGWLRRPLVPGTG